MPDTSPVQTYALALQHHRAGRLREAESLYRQILREFPSHADSLQMLGGIAFLSGRHREAIELISRAIVINPNAAEYHSNLAIVLASSGQPDAAIKSFHKALALRPDYPDAIYNLGKLLASENQIESAIAAYQHVVRLQPTFAEAHNNLGDLFRQTGRFQDAHTSLRQAISIRPDFPEALFNLGLTLADENRLGQAMEAFKDLLRIHPNHPDAHNELGNVLRELNRPREALAAYHRAAELRPNFAKAQWHAGLCHLSLGEFDPGWRLYEARRQLPDWKEPSFHQPQWAGSSLAGKRILLWSEQGFGDTLQFIRYAPILAARGARVLFHCQRPLTRLLSNQLSIDQVIAEGDALPSFDIHCPLLSLPYLLHTTRETIPIVAPYIVPETAATARWRDRIASLPSQLPRVPESPRPGVAIGLAWATNLLPRSALKRWIAPAALAQLAKVPNTLFYSLQKSLPGSPPLLPPPGLPLIDFTAELTDFAETAALIANLDLVITCDTAVAHLAGAMGKPTWIALPFAAPWRWMQDRSDSPWYPTVRLFRQQAPENWASPIANIVSELLAFHAPNSP